MDIEKLKEMKEQVEKAYTFIEQLEEWQTDISNHLALLGRFIDEAIARQQATSEEVQIEINRLQESLNQTKEAAKELKEQKYTVNMLPAYNQIKSLELQIAALQAYQPWIPVSERLPESDDGHQNLVLVLDIGGNYEIEMPSHIIRNIEDYTHWKPLPESPKGE